MIAIDDWGTPWWRELECEATELDVVRLDFLARYASVRIWVALPSAHQPMRRWCVTFENVDVHSFQHSATSSVPAAAQMEIHSFDVDDLDHWFRVDDPERDSKVMVIFESIAIDSLLFTSTQVSITELCDDEQPSVEPSLRGTPLIIYPPTKPPETPREIQHAEARANHRPRQ